MEDLIHYQDILDKDGFHITEYIAVASTATNYGVFFIAIYPCEVLYVAETHRTAGSDASAVTLQVEKLTTGQALDAGVALLQTAFNLKSTADTPVVKSGKDLVFTANSRQMKQGDRLALKDAGTLTAVAGVQVTVYLKRYGKGDYL